ncbi:MAG: hypothetical protein U0X73_15465 [Thermoanaerobaculia bacterium]
MAGSRREKLASIAQWDALKERYPIASRWELLRSGAAVVAANLVTLRLLLRGELQPWELVLLVASEAVAFSAIAWIQSRFVPASARMDKEMPLRERLVTLAFGLFWLAAVYGLILGLFLKDLAPLLAALRDPLRFLATSSIRWPLAISLAGAVVDAVADQRFWRRRGGYFLSTPGFAAGARLLTLFLGGIPFLIPLAIGGWLISQVIQRVEKLLVRPTAGPAKMFAFVAVPAMMIGLFYLMGFLIRGGLLGWAIGYVSAKMASEALILCLPLIANKASAEERAALAAGKTPAKSKRATTS